jgi:hypothetical protein
MCVKSLVSRCDVHPKYSYLVVSPRTRYIIYYAFIRHNKLNNALWESMMKGHITVYHGTAI